MLTFPTDVTEEVGVLLEALPNLALPIPLRTQCAAWTVLGYGMGVIGDAGLGTPPSDAKEGIDLLTTELKKLHDDKVGAGILWTVIIPLLLQLLKGWLAKGATLHAEPIPELILPPVPETSHPKIKRRGGPAKRGKK